ncbi:MAG: sigma-70 family RNA polymerase sigma factor [Flavobacteriia bacterium]|nr:sigma-70 family RNA polymerase sigma factor [Flavobacteriia bacterium]
MFKKRKIKSLSDTDLIQLSKVDSRNFGELYERYFDCIFRFIFKRLGGNETIAGDLTQQTFMKAMANISKYEDRGMPFSSWLYRIAQNEVNLFFRENKKDFTIDIEERQIISILEEAEIGQYMSLEDQEKLMTVINELDAEHLDLVELRFFQELSFKEIAAIYSITEANAKMKIYRILEKMNLKWKESK